MDLKARSLPAVLDRINAVGGRVVYASEHDGGIRAALPLLSIESVADISDVQWVRTAARARTNVAVSQLDPFARPMAPLSVVRQRGHEALEQQFQQSLPLLASNGFYPGFTPCSGRCTLRLLSAR